LSGGPSSGYDKDAPALRSGGAGAGNSGAGICYGMQWMAKNLGGKVEPVQRREYGPAHSTWKRRRATSWTVAGKAEIWASHGDNVLELPPGFHADRQDGERDCVGGGSEAEDVCGAVSPGSESHGPRDGDSADFLPVCKAEPKWSGKPSLKRRWKRSAEVGYHHAICGLSGGSDSTVAAGAGASRDGRAADEYFRKTPGCCGRTSLSTRWRCTANGWGCGDWVDALGTFSGEAGGVGSGAERKIIGREFITIFAAEAEKLQKGAAGDIKFLGRVRLSRRD